MVEIETEQPSGLQEPVGTESDVPEVVHLALALPLDEQRDLLLALAPRIIPRLDDTNRRRFISELRGVRAEARLTTETGETPERDPEEVLEEVLRQSIGAQSHILHMLATRYLSDVDAPARERLLDRLDRVLAEATTGEELPTVH